MKEAIEKIAIQAKEAAYVLNSISTVEKNKALCAMADDLIREMHFILAENAKDMEAARKDGMTGSMLDRLLLTDDRIEEMALGLKQVASLPDPVGEVIAGWQLPNGLSVCNVRVPLGVIGIIYESRPNVTADAAGLCLKTGNAVILRGGSEAFNSNKAITAVLVSALTASGLPKEAIQLVDTTDRKAIDILLRLHDYIDVIIPRGGAGLIKKVVETSSVPVIQTGVGVCHVFVDETADFDMATNIILNAKVSRPSVCNAMETLLVHKGISLSFLPKILRSLSEARVEIFGDPDVCALYNKAIPADENTWSKEYSDLKISVKVVADVNEAISHINQYGSKHSEAIVTENYADARLFQQKVDAAAVYVNASTRFTDGFEFGFGAEIGISTQKLHARGPMGLKELTSAKYLISGNGQIR